MTGLKLPKYIPTPSKISDSKRKRGAKLVILAMFADDHLSETQNFRLIN